MKQSIREKNTFIKVIQYFIVYSIIGLIIEMIYGLLVTGTLECRQSFLYGPFSCIYGLGAVIMIGILKPISKSKYKVFIGGIILGTIIEYSISLIGEFMYHVKWWDYSNIPFNINGRTCLLFGIIWGLLAVYFISYFNPKFDMWLNKMNTKFINTLSVIIIFVFAFDCILTSIALNNFYARLANDYGINIVNSEKLVENYNNVYKNDTMQKLTYMFFSTEKMVKTFPNLLITLDDGSMVYLRDLFPQIKPYYLKISKEKSNIYKSLDFF